MQKQVPWRVQLHPVLLISFPRGRIHYRYPQEQSSTCRQTFSAGREHLPAVLDVLEYVMEHDEVKLIGYRFQSQLANRQPRKHFKIGGKEWIHSCQMPKPGSMKNAQ